MDDGFAAQCAYEQRRQREHRERVRRTLAAVEERIRTRRADMEARYRERVDRVLAAAEQRS